MLNRKRVLAGNKPPHVSFALLFKKKQIRGRGIVFFLLLLLLVLLLPQPGRMTARWGFHADGGTAVRTISWI